MLDWVGSNQPMKMKETSRAKDKKLLVNNIRSEKRILSHYLPYADVFFTPEVKLYVVAIHLNKVKK